MTRFLIVANRTLAGSHLVAEILRRQGEGPCRFHLVVPASHPKGAWTDEGVRSEAASRLSQVMTQLEGEGIEVTGEVGDASPVLAVEDVLRREDFDEIILSTFPVHLSHWLRQDVAGRLRRDTNLPVHHVVAEHDVVS